MFLVTIPTRTYFLVLLVYSFQQLLLNKLIWSDNWKPITRLIGSYTSPYIEDLGFLPRVWEIQSFHEWSIAERVERHWISITSGRNPRSSIRTSASTCFFRFNLKTTYVDFIHSFACQCHVYYTKYCNATCNTVNTHLSKTALNLLGEIS